VSGPVELHFESAGAHDAPALLLGPSLGSSTAMWEPNVAVLAERMRVIRYDHRGEGESPVPPGPYEIGDIAGDVLSLMDRLDIERASFCGLSLGGMVGMWLGANAPERVDRLVLMCTSSHMAPASAWAERAAAVREAGTVEAVADGVVERWLTPPYARAHPEIREQLRAMLASQPTDGYVECCGAIERLDLRDDLQRISAPTLVIGGEDDPATPPEHQRLIAERIPGARLVLLRDAAHIANVEQADAVNALILEHVDP
jgi:3-oxoadipate enol-lactonase